MYFYLLQMSFIDSKPEIAVCVNCYHGSDVSRLAVQLASLLVDVDARVMDCGDDSGIDRIDSRVDKIDHVDKIDSKIDKIDQVDSSIKIDSKIDTKPIADKIYHQNFNSVKEALSYFLLSGFKRCKTKNIKIAFYCDSTSGYQYSSLEDFKKRIDISHFNEIFNSYKLFARDIKHFYYFVYKRYQNSPLRLTNFPEIPVLRSVVATYEHYKTSERLRKDFNNYVKQFCNAHKIPVRIPAMFDSVEFASWNYVLNYKIRESEQGYEAFRYFLETSTVSKALIHTINSQFAKDYPDGYSLNYFEFLEIYEKQPELFDKEIEKWYQSFKNYNENIENVKRLFAEFHEEYPNSTFQGTKYHTNLMINRNQFLMDYDSHIKFFVDDDDISCGVDNYNLIVDQYCLEMEKVMKSKETKVFIDYLKQLDPSFKNPHADFRKKLKYWFLPTTQFKRYLYIHYMTMCVYNVRCVVAEKNEQGIQNLHFSRIESMKSKTKIIGMWNKVIPPYLPFNYLNVQETLNEDTGFCSMHLTGMNLLETPVNIYYYINRSYSNYFNSLRSEPEMAKRIMSVNVELDPTYHMYSNLGRYYYKYDSIVEFCVHREDEDKTELRFVCDRNRKIGSEFLKIVKDKFEDESQAPKRFVDAWNDKLSREPLRLLY